MSRKSRPVARSLATLLSVLALVASIPSAASAANVWSFWVEEVTNRSTKAEIPFAVILSIPAMVVITPFWVGNLALAAISGDEDGEEEEY